MCLNTWLSAGDFSSHIHVYLPCLSIFYVSLHPEVKLFTNVLSAKLYLQLDGNYVLYIVQPLVCWSLMFTWHRKKIIRIIFQQSHSVQRRLRSKVPPPSLSSHSLWQEQVLFFPSSLSAFQNSWVRIIRRVPNVSMYTHSILCLINGGGEYRRKGLEVCSSHIVRIWKIPQCSKKLLQWAQKPYLVV